MLLCILRTECSLAFGVRRLHFSASNKHVHSVEDSSGDSHRCRVHRRRSIVRTSERSGLQGVYVDKISRSSVAPAVYVLFRLDFGSTNRDKRFVARFVCPPELAPKARSKRATLEQNETEVTDEELDDFYLFW
jgi:hypothetical protein